MDPLVHAPPAFTPASQMGFLRTFGPRADPGAALTWGLMDISIAVVVIVTILIALGVLLRRDRSKPDAPPPARLISSGPSWIYVGVALTIVALGVSLIWTVRVMAQINSPATRPAVTIAITGRQWWWEARYTADGAGPGFVTANEIHIPVGQPVLIELTSTDVIHSFWVPALTGKTDTIPGRTNIAWLQADRAGVYRGQCTEYCGVEHALMALYVVAEPPAQFDAWRRAQLAPANTPTPGDATEGQAVFQARCARCHAVQGGPARGARGPDLTHLMSRQTIASGILPNDLASLSGWVSNPQALKPGSLMPATGLSGAELNAVVAYLRTLT